MAADTSLQRLDTGFVVLVPNVPILHQPALAMAVAELFGANGLPP